MKELERELRRKEKALAETAALLVLGKKFDAYWKKKRGQLISLTDRQKHAQLVSTAIASGARQDKIRLVK